MKRRFLLKHQRKSFMITLRPQGDVTEVEQRCELAPPDESPMARMVNEDLVRQSRAEVSANLRRLKSIVEGRLAQS